MTPTIQIVDDDPSVRESLLFLLKAHGYQVQSHCGAQEFLDSYDGTAAGCLILDVRMPGMDGLQLQKLLAERFPGLPIVMLTAHGDLPMAVDAIRSGAWHFVEKPYERDRLLSIVDDAVQADRNWRANQAERVEVRARLAALTDREREVLQLLVDGKSTKVAAMVLGTSPNTIAHQRASILDKMQAESVVDLTRMILLVRE